MMTRSCNGWLTAGLVAGSAALSLPVGAQQTDSFPTKPIRIVVPFPPGGTTDNVARALGERLARMTGQPVLVENKPGASGAIGAEAVARSRGDGYTLLLTLGSALTLSPFTVKVSYDPVKDFRPVTQVARASLVLYANPSVPAKDLNGLIAWMRANPGKLDYGSFSPGSTSHFAGILLNQLAGTDMHHVGYKGSAPAVQDLVGGQIRLMFDSPSNAMPYVKAGRLLALAVTSAARTDTAPGVPTFRELGYPGMEQLNGYFGLYAPSSITQSRLARVNRLAVEALQAPEFAERFKTLGMMPPSVTDPEAFARQVGSERDKWAAFVRQIGYVAER